jgi:YidC/Oxa1 family membrane protein insertase
MGFMSGIFTLAPQALTEPAWGWLGWFLNSINSVIGNAGWTMVIFTVLLKIVTFPLDYYSRYKMKKNAVIMENMKPQLEKLEKQCKGDKQLYNQRMLPLLKKEGYSLGGACLPVLITFVLFIFIFSGLNSYATYRNAKNYNELVNEYNSMIASAENGGQGLDPVADKEEINQNLIEKYNELNPRWLWVKNPWRPDVAYTTGFFNFIAGVNPIASYEEFAHIDGKSNYGVGAMDIGGEGISQDRIDYNTIMGPIAQAQGNGNGMYILIVLAVGISFLSQYVMQKTQNSSQQAADGMGMSAGSMKFMMILFPLMLGYFAFSYSAVFTLYIITNSALSLGTTIAINYIVEIKMKKLKEQKLAEIRYRR